MAKAVEDYLKQACQRLQNSQIPEEKKISFSKKKSFTENEKNPFEANLLDN